MSRPFSYNDDNFTVIGNILFCHIKLSTEVKTGEHIVEVPSAIYDRLAYTTNSMTRERDVLNAFASYAFSVGIVRQDGKYYMVSNADLNGKLYKYLAGYYYLKDI